MKVIANIYESKGYFTPNLWLNEENNSRSNGQKTIFTLVSGFIDGEGNFQVFIDRHYLRAVFRIRLHIDDIATLYIIKEFLGVGNVTIHGSNCLYTISDLYS